MAMPGAQIAFQGFPGTFEGFPSPGGDDTLPRCLHTFTSRASPTSGAHGPSVFCDLRGPALPEPGALPRPPRAEVHLVVGDASPYHARSLAAGGRELSSLRERGWGHWAAYSLDRDGHVRAFAQLTEPEEALRSPSQPLQRTDDGHPKGA